MGRLEYHRNRVISVGSVIAAFAVVSLNAFCAAATEAATDYLGGRNPDASSAIPLKREFPVNDKVNPCEDFYQHACSMAVDAFKLREDRLLHVFSMSDSSERLLDLKKNYLKGLPQQSKLGRFGKGLSTVFQACMNEEGSKKEEIAEVKQWVARVEKLTSREDFLELLGKNIDSEDPSFFVFDQEPNFDNPLVKDFFLVAQLQTLPERSYYQNAELMKAWQELVVDFFKTVGVPDSERRAKGVVDFEKEFAQSYPLPQEFRELATMRTQISKADLLKKFPNFKFEAILKRVPDQTLIRDFTPKNFEWLSQALEKLPIATLKSVFLYHALAGQLDDAFPEFFKKRFEFNRKYLGGPNQRPDRQERCTRLVMGEFEKEIDFEVVEQAFKEFPDGQFVDFVERIRAAIVQQLEKNHWLSQETKQAAMTKMQKARLQLVKPLNDEEWRFNPQVEYSAETPHLNMKRLNRALRERLLRELGIPRNPHVWDIGPLTINAYYNLNDNSFFMPLGILQPPLYDPKRPDSMNFGGIGAVIGHELGHGIDDQGAKFDSTGRLKNWFSEKDLAQFKERGNKLIGFYDRAGVNGKLTLGENIGDLVGVTAAFQAAFGDLDKSRYPEARKFFLEYAHTWCGVARPKVIERRLKTDPHSPFYVRVNEVVRQIDGFQAAFACKKGDSLYLDPASRVRIW